MKTFLLAGLVTCAIAVHAQQKKIKSVEIGPGVAFASVDRTGDLYLVFKNGAVEKINKDGDRLASTKLSSTPTVFDPRDGVLAFSFQRKENTFTYFSPDLSVSSIQKVHPEFALDPWLICPSKNEIWILDSADLSLKKTGANTHLIQKDVPWPLKEKSSASSLSFMREYQNFLFILDRDKGVHVINSFGKWIKTLGAPGMDHFHFLGEEFYFQQGNTLRFTDLYTAEERAVELPATCDYAVLTDERMYLIRGSRLDIFEFKP